MRRLFVAGNWKMTTNRQSATQLAAAVVDQVPAGSDDVDILVCPPFPYLDAVGAIVADSAVGLGAQNAYFEEPGAFTGEVAVEMLLDVGCDWVILGHSERRHVLGECDTLINKKVSAALKKGLKVILCVGEQLREREAEQTEAILDSQLTGALDGVDESLVADLVIAYEPVWAIGTGLTATPDQAESAHAHLRNWLTSRYNPAVADATRILYGGSVKADNALSLLRQPNVDGALVGGASLKAETFVPIIKAAVELSGTD